jgi:hypothetical protein
MRFCDLTKDQRTEAKQRLLCERLEKNENRTPSYGELADVDEAVSDKEAEEAYAGTEFVPDDFSCGEAADRDGVLSELKEWAERELLMGRYAKPGAAMRLSLEVELGIDWARKALLDHIEAVRP